MEMNIEQENFADKISHYLNFANFLADRLSRKYCAFSSGLSSDFRSEAWLGLCIAAKSFTSQDEKKFESYLAAVVSNRIRRYVLNAEAPISLKYSTICALQKTEDSSCESKSARMFGRSVERREYSDDTFECAASIDDYYRKEKEGEEYFSSLVELRKVREALQHLSEESREILHCLYYEDSSPYELAKKMNFSPVAIYQKRNRAVKELSKALRKKPRKQQLI